LEDDLSYRSSAPISGTDTPQQDPWPAAAPA